VKIAIIIDGVSKSPLSNWLADSMRDLIIKAGHSIEIIELKSDDLKPCSGCFCCLKGGEGDCIAKDGLKELRLRTRGSRMAIFLSPARFGQCSSIIKNAMDKGLARSLGSSDNVQGEFYVGYGEDVDEEERSTFIDCLLKHQGRADLVHVEYMALRIEAHVARTMAEAQGIVDRLRLRIAEEVEA
jgi:multimeric flavodoxin WrbA